MESEDIEIFTGALKMLVTSYKCVLILHTTFCFQVSLQYCLVESDVHIDIYRSVSTVCGSTAQEEFLTNVKNETTSRFPSFKKSLLCVLLNVGQFPF